MSLNEIESRIQDTTHFVDASDVASPDDSASRSPALCSCGLFPALTEGSGSLLNKCKECFTSLQAELDEDSGDYSAPLATDAGAAINDNPDDDDFVELQNFADESEPMTVEAVEGALALAMTDAARSCTLVLNKQAETFVHYVDPINKPKGRQLFLRESWQLMYEPLYWYLAIGAIFTGKTVIVTPCMVRLKGNAEVLVVLYALLETMCNRPRYDGLCVQLETKAAFIVENIASVAIDFNLGATFDRIEVDRCVYCQ